MEHRGSADLQRQVDELVALVEQGREDIEALECRAQAAEARVDRNTDRITVNRSDIDELQEHVSVDRELIAELQANGVVSREHTAQLEKALATSRTIGAAVGVLMASRNIGQAEALEMLKSASSRANTPMRQLAEVIVATPRAGSARSASVG